MSEETFSGFMPMIGKINLTEQTPMINTDGDLMSAHAVTIECTNGEKHVFSINSFDLMRLHFLINKVISLG